MSQVIDSTDRERISVSKEELHRMLESDELCKASVLVFANKQDVAGCMTATEISQQLSLQVKHVDYEQTRCSRRCSTNTFVIH